MARPRRGSLDEHFVEAPSEWVRAKAELFRVRPDDVTKESLWICELKRLLKKILGKESPQGLAARLVSGSKLGDPALRKALWDGGLAAIEASDDPMIQFVLRTEGQGRALKKVWESQVTAPVDSAAERIAQARFAVYGESVYPDATFSLRLSYGKVAGWTYRGTTVPAFTRMAKPVSTDANSTMPSTPSRNIGQCGRA